MDRFIVGMIEYINAFPFRMGMEHMDTTFIFGVPSTINKLLRSGELDIALTSSVAYFEGPFQMVPPGFGIAAHDEILSVNLYLRGALRDNIRIGITHHSATSAALLKVLCHHFWKVEALFEPLTDTCDGFLLIGDEALKQRTISGYQTIDLAAAWYKATQLPFVFAVFMQKEGMNCSAQLESALQWSEAHREMIVEKAHLKTGLPKLLINKYYDKCHYRLGPRELEGLNLFKELSNVQQVYS